MDWWPGIRWNDGPIGMDSVRTVYAGLVYAFGPSKMAMSTSFSCDQKG